MSAELQRILPLLCFILLAACGQKGDLYLPPASEASTQVQSDTAVPQDPDEPNESN